jgi:transcriptional regulator with XRE-family HTH domain
MDLKALGARIKELRTAAGLSQRELAAKAGLAHASLTSWEQGIREPGWLTVLALAAALGVDCKAFEREPTAVPEPKRGRPARPKPAAKKKAKGKGKGRRG